MKKNPTKNKLSRQTLESLSEAELAELILVAEEQTRQNRPDVVYEPNPIQKKVHKSDSFIRALFSGNGVGKTTACIQEAIWTATGTHPYRDTARIPNTTIIVLDDPSKADTVYVKNLRDRKWYDTSKLTFNKHGRSFTNEIIFPNGSRWIFMTHEMGEDRWESIECSGVIFDEPPPRFIFIALLRGQREKDMRPWIMFAGTPRGKNAAWMYKEIYKPWKLHSDPEIECFFGSTYDNLSNLDPETINRWKKRYTEQELKTRVFGEFEFLSGAIFCSFSRDTHVEPSFVWPWSWTCILAIDPHVRKNHCAVVLGVDPDKELWVIRELETSLSGRAAAEFFLRACEDLNIKVGICDNYGSMPMTGGEGRKSFIDVFNETATVINSRVRIRPTTRAEKGDDEWIEDCREWLRLVPDNSGKERPRMHVFDSCPKTIDNFESYRWDDHKGAGADGKDVKEKPLGTDCDFLMCVKYGLATKPDRLGEDRVYRRKPGRINSGNREYESFGKNSWLED